MADEPRGGTAPLDLQAEFPPTSTAEWDAVVRQDLKGADYDKKLVWRTDEGIAVQPFYRRDDLAGLDAQTTAAPGAFPFVRGDTTTWQAVDAPVQPADAIRADRFHEAGATAVQELGYGIAQGIDRLASLVAEGHTPDAAARSLSFVVAVGSTYFLEIAKLRAARLLWAQAVAAFGPATPEAAVMRLHVRTSRANKSSYDAYTNLLRVTTEAMSAAIGGADTLLVEAYGFDPHLALNVQRILEEESHLDVVADPAGGSYFIEHLTDALAREAWGLVQQVEAAGGFAKALEAGLVTDAIARSRAAKETAVSSRRRTLVGVNNYPDLGEKTPSTEALPGGDGDARLPAFRMAEPFERIRERTLRHAQKTGAYPKVLLLTRGDVKMRTARANFCLNFFGCAGFDVVQSEDHAVPADLVVLCSSDPEYPALAADVVPRVSAPVIVAGNPKEQAPLTAAGVQGFVHLGSDAVATLTEWQDRLGL
jgi:methylmalonyl-CoA mutase